jgi:hypothetical protein
MKFYTDAWKPNTVYKVNDAVYIDDFGIQHWYCHVAHTSTSSFDYSKFYPITSDAPWRSTARDTYYSKNFFAVDAIKLHIPGYDNVRSDATALRFNNGGMDLTLSEGDYEGDQPWPYYGQGDFLGFSTVSEDFDIKVGKFDVTLSGAGTWLVDHFAQNIDFEGCRVQIWKVLLDYDTLQPKYDMVIPIFDGVIFNVKIVESAVTCTISVECATLWADFERTKGRKTNNESNWLYQAGNKSDLCFSKTATVGQVTYQWGKK